MARVALLFTLTSLAAWAHPIQPEDAVEALYAVSTDGSTTRLKAGAPGKLVLSVNAKEKAHISDDAPLKITLVFKGASSDKTSLTYADSVAKKTGAVKYPNPRFEVPFVAAKTKGKGSIEATMVLFVCVEKLCYKADRTVVVPLEIN